MSDSDDELAAIRAQRREELAAELGDGGEEGTATPSEPIHVESADHFRAVLADHDVVLVDFHAEWCGPCKMLEPVVEELARETGAAVAKVDIDAHQQLASAHGVRSVPTLKVFANGEQATRLVGAQPKDRLRSAIEAHL